MCARVPSSPSVAAGSIDPGTGGRRGSRPDGSGGREAGFMMRRARVRGVAILPEKARLRATRGGWLHGAALVTRNVRGAPGWRDKKVATGRGACGPRQDPRQGVGALFLDDGVSKGRVAAPTPHSWPQRRGVHAASRAPHTVPGYRAHATSRHGRGGGPASRPGGADGTTADRAIQRRCRSCGAGARSAPCVRQVVPDSAQPLRQCPRRRSGAVTGGFRGATPYGLAPTERAWRVPPDTRMARPSAGFSLTISTRPRAAVCAGGGGHRPRGRRSFESVTTAAVQARQFLRATRRSFLRPAGRGGGMPQMRQSEPTVRA